MMKEMTDRLGADEDLAARYRAAHEAYLAHREAHRTRRRRSPASAPAGCPTRVKCLHVLVGHSLAAGPGVNPLGDEALDALETGAAGGPVSNLPGQGCGGRLRHQLFPAAVADLVDGGSRARPADDDRPARPGRRRDRRIRPGRAGADVRGLRRVRRSIRAAGVDRIRFVATSAARDVENRDEFFAGSATGWVEPDIISGDEEAGLASAARPAGSAPTFPGRPWSRTSAAVRRN